MRFVVGVVLALALTSAPSAASNGGSGLDPGTTDIGESASGVWVGAVAAGSEVVVSSGVVRPGSGGAGGTRPALRCIWLGGQAPVQDVFVPGAVVAGGWYWFWCERADTPGVVVVPPYRRQYLPPTGGVGGEVITPDGLVARAVDELPLIAPVVDASPPGGRLYVNVPSYLAVTNPNGDGATALARPPGVDLWAHAEARLASVVFDPGNGDEPVVCDGWGNLFDTQDPARLPDCGYTYLRAGEFVVSATVSWEITYASSDTPAGVWGTVTRTGTFPVQVFELEVVVTD